MNRVNIRRFEFDFDTTWTAFFLDEDLNVYSRYGGRDEGEPEARLSKQSLLQTMGEVLDVHTRRQALRQLADAKIIQPITKGVSTPEDIPLLKAGHRGCVHCHQIREYQYLQWYKSGKFDRDKLFVYPLPENIGLTFDRQHGHRIEKVLKNSPAAGTLLQPGDVVTQINDVPIRSEYDVRWALGRVIDGKPITAIAQRFTAGEVGKSQTIRVQMTLTAGWRQTDIGWQKSIRSVPLQLGMRGYSIAKSQRKSEQIAEDKLAIRVISVRGGGIGEILKLQKRDLIIAVGDRSKRRTFSGFKADLVSFYRPGETIHLTVRRDGKTIELTGTFPAWFTDETTVP